MCFDSEQKMVNMTAPPPLVDRETALAIWGVKALAALKFKDDWCTKFSDAKLKEL